MAIKISEMTPAVQSFAGDITEVSQGFPGVPVTRHVTETQRFDLTKTFMAADLPLVYTSVTAAYSININATNLRLDGSDLNTIQDIDSTASPEFSNLALSTASPNPVSILHASSTTKGVLFSPMTEAQRDAIATPPEGLEVFNLTSHKKNFFNGTIWVESDDLPVFTTRAVPFGKGDGTLTEDPAHFTFNSAMDQLSVGAANTSITINGETRNGSFLAVSNGVPEKWGLIAQAFGTTTSSLITLTRARGNDVAPSASNAGDVLGGLCFAGYDGTDYGYSGRMECVASANHAVGDTPGYLVWLTTGVGDEVSVEAMRLTDAGDLGIGETVPEDKLHVSDTIENTRIRVENTGVAGNRNAGVLQKNSAHEVFTGVSGTAPATWQVYSNTDTEPRISVDLDSKNVVISDSGATVTHNADILLDMQSSALAVKDPVLTTTARNLLTGVEGMRIFNTTTKQFEGYNGTTWVILG